ncbi:hypothetical protein H9Q08_03215 [Chryseobacterium sp. PS-8]|uniref:Uncharacterized protein n=1 Tax=Chryseobacterium indicum TaxID=2766954 RepID=A0ABS9C3P7_9FLAO|nr:hypothetical protein [Chryseobacterium sp. PS-8]MCF2218309.1 hypothetical protein [Chryseobacterium sp. PS-8]
MSTILYGLVWYVFLVPILQSFIPFSYFWRFAKEYLHGEPTSWNPKTDRLLLTFSFFFTGFSIMVSRQILKGETEDSLSLTLLNVFSLTVFLLFTGMLFYLRRKDLKKFSEAKFTLTMPSSNIKDSKKMSYGNVIPNTIKMKIFESLRKYSFIDDDLSQDDFEIQFLVEPIRLNMTVPAFREFYNLLTQNFPKLKRIKQKDFVKLFINSRKEDFYDIDQFGKSSVPTSRLSTDLNLIFKDLKR